MVVVAGRLTDRQRKKIIADYADGASIRQLAKKYGVSSTTIHRTLKGDPETERLVTQKKEENTADILAYMETKMDVVNKIIDRYLIALLEEERIAKATPAQLTTALGTLIDKFTAQGKDTADIENLTPLAELLK